MNEERNLTVRITDVDGSAEVFEFRFSTEEERREFLDGFKKLVRPSLN
jgi:hypothetical protein